MEKRILSCSSEQELEISRVYKRKKEEEEEEEEEHGNVDMISHLPDPLVHYIFSFLDMKQAIQTCILSRRWRYFWVSLPTLNFNYKRGFRYLETRNKTNFMDFVDRVLMIRDSSNIQKLAVVIKEQCDITERLNTWILTSVIRNIQELSLQIYTAREFWEFPKCLSNCKSLTKLVLALSGPPTFFKCTEIYLPGFGSCSFTLPRLKTLSIEAVQFDRRNSIDGFISQRCLPVLETLILIDVHFLFGSLSISSLKLKHLKLKSCGRVCHGVKSLFDLHLCTPNLLSFYYHGWMLKPCVRERLSSLVKADIHVKENPKVSTKEMSCSQQATTILTELNNVEELTLSFKILKIVTGAPELLDDSMKYRKLKCLKLEGSKFSIDRIRVISYMLKASPNIENLSVMLRCFLDCNCLHCKETRTNSTNERDCPGAGFSLQCLKFFEFRNVGACVSELKFIEILLNKAMMLERLFIVFGFKEISSDERRCRAQFSEKVVSAPALLQSNFIYRNLRNLKMDAPLSVASIHTIICLLKMCPTIETLFVKKEMNFDWSLIEVDWEVGLPSECLLNHLKCVEIREAKGCASELWFLETLLKNAVVLDTLMIVFSATNVSATDRQRQLVKFREKLRALPKASPSITTMLI